jgi:hypothetical protein
MITESNKWDELEETEDREEPSFTLLLGRLELSEKIDVPRAIASIEQSLRRTLVRSEH